MLFFFFSTLVSVLHCVRAERNISIITLSPTYLHMHVKSHTAKRWKYFCTIFFFLWRSLRNNLNFVRFRRIPDIWEKINIYIYIKFFFFSQFLHCVKGIRIFKKERIDFSAAQIICYLKKWVREKKSIYIPLLIELDYKKIFKVQKIFSVWEKNKIKKNIVLHKRGWKLWKYNNNNKNIIIQHH